MNEEKLLFLYDQGLTDLEISELTGNAYSSIRKFRESRGLPTNIQLYPRFAQAREFYTKQINKKWIQKIRNQSREE